MDSPVPLYARVEEALLNRIRRDCAPGDLLPTQQQLADEFGASMITIRRALANIAGRGLIESVRGRGTVVRRPTVSDFHGGISSWTDSIAGLGAVPRTAWTRIHTHVPPPEVARQLNLKARARTVLIERLRTIDGEPICLMTNELVESLVPGLADRGLDEESLYACLTKRYKLRPITADEEVTARPAQPHERKLLGKDTRLVMVIRRLTLLKNDQPLELATIVAPAHRYQYRVRLNAANESYTG